MLKVAAKRMLQAGGRLTSGDSARRVTVLCYHSVHPTHPFRSATPELFGQHLSWLEDQCDVVPFTDVLAATTTERRRPAVSITFDDGYDDNHTRIFETNDPVELLREKVLGYWDPIGFVDLTPSWLSGLVSPVDFAY